MRRLVAATAVAAALLAPAPAPAAVGTFSGSFEATSCSGFSDVAVGAGVEELEIEVTATIPANDILLELHHPRGTIVASANGPTGAETIHYAPATGVEAGTYGIRICPSPSAHLLVPPLTFAGTFATIDVPPLPTGEPRPPTLPPPVPPPPPPAPAPPRRPPLPATFNPSLLLGGSAGAGEPSVRTTSGGVPFVIAPTGVPLGCKAFRVSHDGSRSTFLGYPDGTVGGGDCDWAIGPGGVLAYSSLSLANLTVGKSEDGGTTFGPPNPLSQQVVLDDRQWMAADPQPNALGHATIYMIYHDSSTGQIQLGVSRDGGFTYTQSTPVINPAEVPLDQWTARYAGNELGNLVARRDSTGLKLYTIFATPDSGLDNLRQRAATSSDFNRVYAAVGTVAGATVVWHDYEIWHGPVGARYNRIFPVIAADVSGRVYAVFTDGTHVLLKSDADGMHWQPSEPPLELDAAGANAVVFPWVVAGGAGMVDVAWYGARGGASGGANPSDDPANRWHVYLAQTLDGGRSWGTFRASDHVLHNGPICIDGLDCMSSATPRDRTLLDFFQIALDPTSGAVDIAYTDDHAAPHYPVLYFTRQCTGSSATTGEPLANDCVAPPPPPTPPAPSACPGPQVTDFDGDAPNGYTAGDGKNMANFDIIRASFESSVPGLLKVTLTLEDLNGPPPPANLPSAAWRVYWDYHGTTYGVEADATGGAVQAYVVGTYDRATARFARGASVRGEFHPGPAGTIVWFVPLEEIGSPGRGAVLTAPYADDYGTVELAGKGLRYPRPGDRAPDGGSGADYRLNCGRAPDRAAGRSARRGKLAPSRPR